MSQRRAGGGRHKGAGARLGAAFCLLCAVLGALLIPPSPAPAQQVPPERTFYTRHREFNIPFDIDPAERRIAGVRMHVSENLGQTWEQRGTAQPGDKFFNFKAERDGRAYLCGCKTSQGRPHCDGRHSRL